MNASDATQRICCDCLLPNGLRCNNRTVVVEPGKARCTDCHAEALAADLAVQS